MKNNAFKRLLRNLLIIAIPALLTACGGLGVKPWQRDLMARPTMLPEANPAETSIDEQIYFSKEAASGGRGFGGGGCGCN